MHFLCHFIFRLFYCGTEWKDAGKTPGKMVYKTKEIIGINIELMENVSTL